MKLSTILVHVDDTPTCGARLRLAAQLAGAHRAHLIGLAATPALADEFTRGIANAGAPSIQAVIDERDAAQALAEHALSSDLLVLGHGAPHDRHPNLLHHQLTRGACPLLAVPIHAAAPGASMSLPRRVMLAWDGSREASRAIRDALPLLCMAEQVELVCCERVGTLEVSRAQLGHLRQWLGRHRVDVRLHWGVASSDIGDELLLRARQLEAGLIVMGGYGHSPLVESMFGGVTRAVLARAQVPVFLSH